jgi:hypothetical protein
MGSLTWNRFQPFFCKLGGNAKISNSAHFECDQSRGIGLAGTRIYHVSRGKLGYPYNKALRCRACSRIHSRVPHFRIMSSSTLPLHFTVYCYLQLAFKEREKSSVPRGQIGSYFRSQFVSELKEIEIVIDGRRHQTVLTKIGWICINFCIEVNAT